MRFIHLYLVGYFVLVVGAAMALCQSGVLARMSAMWIAISLIIALGLGIMLAVSIGQAHGHARISSGSVRSSAPRLAGTTLPDAPPAGSADSQIFFPFPPIRPPSWHALWFYSSGMRRLTVASLPSRSFRRS